MSVSLGRRPGRWALTQRVMMAATNTASTNRTTRPRYTPTAIRAGRTGSVKPISALATFTGDYPPVSRARGGAAAPRSRSFNAARPSGDPIS